MRPQHITAENVGSVIRQLFVGGCFNEAAAYHCGKRGRARAHVLFDVLLQ